MLNKIQAGIADSRYIKVFNGCVCLSNQNDVIGYDDYTSEHGRESILVAEWTVDGAVHSLICDAHHFRGWVYHVDGVEYPMPSFVIIE